MLTWILGYFWSLPRGVSPRLECGREIFAQCIIDRFAFDLEMLMRAQKAGCSVTELPVKIVNHRESSIHLLRDSTRMLRDIMKIKKALK